LDVPATFFVACELERRRAWGAADRRDFFAIWRGRALNRLMIEQTDVPAGTRPDGPVVPPRPVLSNEVRASLEAVRAARDAALGRARRQTVQARVWFATMAAALATAAFVFAPRVARWRHARAQATIVPHVASRPPAPPEPQVVDRVAVAPTQPAPTTELPAAAAVIADAPAAPVAKAEPARPVVAPDRAGDAPSIRHAWRLSPEACVRAFEADPGNGALALAVAQAEYARTHVARAAQWARRALALDPNLPEAHIIIARGEAEDGRADEARAAYARYLELAPHGWHQAEARAALRRPASSPSADSAGNR
jgi:tetratricopeptide (TPR) repeat protein